MVSKVEVEHPLALFPTVSPPSHFLICYLTLGTGGWESVERDGARLGSHWGCIHYCGHLGPIEHTSVDFLPRCVEASSHISQVAIQPTVQGRELEKEGMIQSR